MKKEIEDILIEKELIEFYKGLFLKQIITQNEYKKALDCITEKDTKNLTN